MPIKRHRRIVWMTLIGMLAFGGAMILLAGRAPLRAAPLPLATMTDDEICRVLRGNWLSSSVTYFPRPSDGPPYGKILLMAGPGNPHRMAFLSAPGFQTLNIRYLGIDPLRDEWQTRGDSEPGWIRRDAPNKFSIWFGPSGSALRYDLTIASDELRLSGKDLTARFRRAW